MKKLLSGIKKFIRKLFEKQSTVQMRKIKCGCTDDTCGCR